MTREEAIEIVKKNWPEGRHQIKEALEFLVPELKESDDERIRKWIISVIEEVKTDDDWCVDQRKCADALAWLEKQKEKEPTEWSEEDELMLNSIIDVLKLTNGAAQMKIDWLKSLRPQSKQEWAEKKNALLEWCMKKAEEYRQMDADFDGNVFIGNRHGILEVVEKIKEL